MSRKRESRTMTEMAVSTAGFMIDARDAYGFVGIWVIVVLIYGLWRSRGDAPQDPIRPSGPGVE